MPPSVRRRYNVQAAQEEEDFDRLTSLATHLFDASAATLELVGDGQGRVLARTGAEGLVGEGETDSLYPVHAQTLETDGTTVLEDLNAHDQFSDHSLVAGDDEPLSSKTALQFYAGAPLTTSDGHRIGVLSVLDTTPHTPPSETVEQLERLAAMATEALERHPCTVAGQPELTQQIVDHLPGLFYVFGPDGRLKHWNRQFETTTGYDTDEFEGRPAYSFFDGDDQWQIAKTVLEAFASGSSAIEADLLTSGGERVPMLFRGERTQVEGEPHLVGMGVDLSEQKEAEDARCEERNRFETLFDSVPTPVVHGVLRNGRFDILTVNGAFESVFGYDADAIEGRNLHTLIVPEEEGDQTVEYDRQALEQESLLRAEVRRRTAEGPRDFQVHRAGRVQENGPPELYAIYADITERKETEATHREREVLLRSITDHISEGIYRSDPERGIVYANEAFVNMFGYDSLEEVQEVDSSDLYADPDERKRLLRRDGEVLEQAEVTFRRKDGTTFVGLLSSRSGRDEADTVEYYDGVITDITERKEYEEQLAYRYELERKIVDVSTQFINTPAEEIDEAIEQALGAVGSFVGADRSYVFFVDKEAQTTSNTHEWCAEGTESHQPDLQDIPYAAMPWFMERMHHRTPLMAAVDDLPDQAFRLQSILEDGDIESLVVLPMTQGDALVGFVGFDAIKTEREWEQDTVMILQVLSGAIANALQRKQMEEDMISARQEAEEANRLKSAFLANMSHEIRTPLTSIIGFAEVIGEEASEENESVTRFADLIHRGGLRLLETLDAVLNLSKLEAHEMKLARRPVNLTDGAEAVAEEHHPRAEDAGVDLIIESPESPVCAKADEGGVQIVAQNLVSNAIKYTESGGEVRVRTYRDEDQSVLEVEDTGIGMDQKLAEDLFKPFRQATEGTTRLYEGTGVGLAVTKQAIEQMDGQIEVDTERGKGSRFTVRLPSATHEQP
ncbi:PAS domain S-box protein [Salinibacter altiplanensis]|uniref:PAS domain S-box protein n=1 Tax=Salinibacter altiplanensis TaxID=1803181 RepID=UPI00131A55EE|nr:PAS domain S-box protein [Salinibacter altiplanensis]